MTTAATFDIRAHDKTKAAFTSVQSRLKGMTKELMSFKGIATAAIGALGIKQLYETAASFEKLEASLKTVTGSMANAKSAMQTIRDFTAKTPFQVTEVADAFIKLKALGLEPSQRALESYGNTSSAMGKSLNQMIEAVADASTGEFERLKEFGIKSRSEGDRVKFTFQGVTTEVGKNSQEIQKYLLDIGQTKFAGAMAEQMNTLGGKSSNLSDSLDNLMVTISELGVGDVMKGALTAAIIGVTEITNGIKKLPSLFVALFSEVDVFFINFKAKAKTFAADVAHIWSNPADTKKRLQDIEATRQAEVDAAHSAAASYIALREQKNSAASAGAADTAAPNANNSDNSKQIEIEIKRQEELNASMLDLSRSFYTEKEKADVLYWERKTELENLYLEGKVSSEEERRALELQITQDHEKSLTAITQKETQQRAAAEQRVSAQILAMKYQVAQQAINLISLVVGESKAGQIVVLALQKGLALSQLAISTQVAMMQAYAQLGPLAGSAAAATIASMGSISAGLIVATGIAQAASIASGGSAPSLGSPTNPVNTQPAVGNTFPGTSASEISQSQSKNVHITVEGNPSKQQVRDMIDAIGEEVKDGYNLTVALA